MEEEKRVQKYNIGYLLAYIMVPIAVVALGFVFTLQLVESSGAAAIIIMVLLAGAVFWWSFVGSAVYDRGQKKRLKALDDQGFVRNQTFESSGCTVALDLVHGKLAMMFRWNPGKTFILPASRITKAWVDDGAGGPGFLNGTSRVSFLFTVDGVTVRVNTFISNRRWSMSSDHVLTGISKADVMVEALNAARGEVV